jgi:hypothetical protein
MVMVKVMLVLLGLLSVKGPEAPVAKEMAHALVLLDQSLGLESYPPPHCLKWGSGKPIKPEDVNECAKKALDGQALPGLGTKYVIAILMAEVGPQTLIALWLDQPGWAVLSCDPGKPCPPRHAGEDKMGKRVVDRTARACKNTSTIWIPDKKGCP